MSARRRVTALAAGAAVVLVGLLPAATSRDQPPAAAPVLVYVSGIDEHLLDAYPHLPLYGAPDGPVIAEIPTGTLAWVHREAGEWLEISLAEEEFTAGWIGDFFLRGELHLVDPDTPGCPVPAAAEPGGPPQAELAPSAKVRLVDLAGVGPTSAVLVELVADATRWWVARPVLSPRPGPDPARSAPGTDCAQISHATPPPHHRRHPDTGGR